MPIVCLAPPLLGAALVIALCVFRQVVHMELADIDPRLKRPWHEYLWITLVIGIAVAAISILIGTMSWLGLYKAVNHASELPVPLWGNANCLTISSAGGLGSAGLPLGSSSNGPMSGSSAGALSACASFAVIASNDSLSTAASFPLLAKLQRIYPLSQYKAYTLNAPLAEPPADASQMAAYINQQLKPAVTALDSLVTPLVQTHVSLIHLGVQPSLLLDAFVRGAVQYTDAQGQKQVVNFFSGKTLAQRYPGQRFSTSDIVVSKAALTAAAGNLLHFADVVTAFDPSLLVPKFTMLGFSPTANTAILVVTQQGDLGANENVAQLTTALAPTLQTMGTGLSSQLFKSINVVYTGTTAAGSFAANQVQAVVNAINGLLADLTLIGSGPAKVIVVINPANYYAAQAAFAAAFDSAFANYNTDGRVVFLGLGFAPRAAAGGFGSGYSIYRGLQVAAPRPTDDLASLGYLGDATALATQIKSDLFVLDAMKFAALCRTPNNSGGALGVTGNALKFDNATGTVIAELLHDDGTLAPAQQLPAGGLDIALRSNGRFSGRAAVPGAK